MDEPYECEGCSGSEDSAGGTDSGDLEFGAGPSAVCGVGKRRRPYARLLAQQLRGDYEVPEVLKESFVVGAAKAGVYRFLYCVRSVAQQGPHSTHRARQMYARNRAMAVRPYA